MGYKEHGLFCFRPYAQEFEVHSFPGQRIQRTEGLIHEQNLWVMNEVPIPPNYPVVGADAFRTATGVHAAAVIKAFNKNDVELANQVYSGVPSHWFGLDQKIEIGPMSGKSNVIYWLQKRGIQPTDELVEKIFSRAKQADRLLTDIEILELCGQPIR